MIMIDLVPVGGASPIDPEQWTRSEYAPLPTLVQAARQVFRHEPLPSIRRAPAARIPAVIEHLVGIADQARRERSRHLALITGVPGAGKTLVGLQFVYQHHFGADPDVTNRAVFLSGNGPLVEVLQHALKSRAFVQPMRKFIKQYGFGTGYPREHVLVFDEAQRAWDVDWVLKKHGHRESEPDLLIKVADWLPGWAMLVGLIGEGQGYVCLRCG